MRCRNKANSMRVILRFTVGLIMGLFVLGIGNIQYVEGSSWHKGRFHKAESLTCGETITTHAVLYNDLDCSSDDSDGPALTLGEGASLDLNGKKVIGNYDRNCIEITGDGAEVRNGIVKHCNNGIVITSNGNKITDVKVSDSASNGILVDKNTKGNEIRYVKVSDSGSRGIRIRGDENLLMTCSVANSGSQGIQIDGTSSNKIYRIIVDHSGRQGIQINGGNFNEISGSTVRDSCRDGIEIEGDQNSVFYNQVEDNGNPEACPPSEVYNPSEYAGIDVTEGSQENEIKGNRACGNLGCFGTDCIATERNFWDENSPNRWEYNSIMCRNVKPKFSGTPPH